ncbi:hypothetical protein J2Z44_002161 [Clostridium punense]|uniref:HTH tetR-type domain-containing protein n=1 Tax=Clostridium punense TaxID=1054297 RepID=A0ABS4K3J0_9CLOT|nr:MULTISPECIES: TetR family transcriptional regulator [Clostridium]EQB87442.1 hypothetical protein M918_08585 [Clostridium sp. BL8]MBP2022340.1 hypothetical protein [Clostridium punense]
MTKSAIEKKEMMISFVNATKKLIEEEGIENVTARRVAQLTGYNVATAYKYFNNLNHVIFFASMKYYNDYIHDLPNYIKETNSSLINYLEIWRCFSIHAFNNPKIFKSLFLDQNPHSVQDTMKQYYELYPDDFRELPQVLLPMLSKDCIVDRDIAILKVCVDDGYIRKEDLEILSKSIVIFFEGLLMKVTNNIDGYNKDHALEIILTYIKNNLHYYNLKAKNMLPEFAELQ